MTAAADYGSRLPTFRDIEDARAALYHERDCRLAALAECARHTDQFRLTFEADSLKALELWYFRLVDLAGFRSPIAARHHFEQCIAAYFGEVLVRSSPPFEWFVEEYAFTPGRYEIGVRRPLLAIMLTGSKAPEPRERNKRMQSLWRQYQRYAG
jgi:hypothetical protein